MTTRAKELADEIRGKIKRECKSVGALVISESAAAEIVAYLDAKAAVDSAVTELPHGLREHVAVWRAALNNPMIDRRGLMPEEHVAWFESLLAIVQRQAGEMMETRRARDAANERLEAARAEVERLRDEASTEIERLTRYGCKAINERDEVRAEVERLKVALAERSPGLRAALNREESAHLKTLAEFDETRAEVERLTALVDEFKAASMLGVGGDPDGVTPRLLEGHVTALQTEVERLKAEFAAAGHVIVRVREEANALRTRAEVAETELAAEKKRADTAEQNARAQAEIARIATDSLDKRTKELLSAEDERDMAKKRADVLAAGIRRYRLGIPQGIDEWEFLSGHLAGDGK